MKALLQHDIARRLGGNINRKSFIEVQHHCEPELTHPPGKNRDPKCRFLLYF